MTTLIATDVVFYSQNDEDAFFNWLNSIAAVKYFRGDGSDLIIEVSADPPDDEIGDIIALFHRYDVDMPQLKKLLNEGNSKWFNSKMTYWHKYVFDQN